MDELKTPASLTNWIVEFFNNRTVQLERSIGNISKQFNVGIPQGSALSPTIFNLYTTKLHQNTTEGTCLIQYADDLVIVGWDEDIKELAINSRKKIDILRYLTNKKWGAHPQTMLNPNCQRLNVQRQNHIKSKHIPRV